MLIILQTVLMMVVKVNNAILVESGQDKIDTHKRKHKKCPSLFWLLPPHLFSSLHLFSFFPSLSLFPWKKSSEFATKLYTVNFPDIISPCFSFLAHSCQNPLNSLGQPRTQGNLLSASFIIIGVNHRFGSKSNCISIKTDRSDYKTVRKHWII